MNVVVVVVVVVVDAADAVAVCLPLSSSLRVAVDDDVVDEEGDDDLPASALDARRRPKEDALLCSFDVPASKPTLLSSDCWAVDEGFDTDAPRSFPR